MKNSLCFIFLFVSVYALAQINDKPAKLLHYALDLFVNGSVKVKSGAVYNQMLNYNLVTREMIFEQGAQYLAIAHPEEVDTVFINDRKFVPVEAAFYEYLGGTIYPVFIEYTCTTKEEGVPIGIGTTNTGAASSQKSLLKDVGAYKLKLPDQFEIIPIHSFYIRKNNSYYKIKNEQQLAKLFPDKKEIIKSWVKNNHTNFSSEKDMLALVQQIQ